MNMKICMNMRTIRCILLSFTLLCVTDAMRADEYDLYLFGAEDDTYTSLDFANLRSLSFKRELTKDESGSNVYISWATANYLDGTSQAYDLANFSAILFESTTVVGIDEVFPTTASLPFRFQGSHLEAVVAGILRISRVDGRPVLQRKVSVGERVSTSSFTPGIYIINIAGATAKILIQ